MHNGKQLVQFGQIFVEQENVKARLFVVINQILQVICMS